MPFIITKNVSISKHYLTQVTIITHLESLPTNSTYSDPTGARARSGQKVDLKSTADVGVLHTHMKSMFEQSAELKNTTTGLGGTGTTDQTLVPLYLDNNIIDQSRVQTPVSAMIPRVTNQGITAEFNVITSKHFGAWNLQRSILYRIRHWRPRFRTSI